MSAAIQASGLARQAPSYPISGTSVNAANVLATISNAPASMAKDGILII